MSVFDAFRRDMKNFTGIGNLSNFKDFRNKELKVGAFGFSSLGAMRPREEQSGLERIKDNILTTIGDALSFGLDRKAKKNLDEAASANRALFNNEIARANAEAASQDADAVKFDAQFAQNAQNNKGN